MTSRAQVIQRLKDRDPRFLLTEADVWDIVPAAKGLTVVMMDGSVLPLPMSDGAARQLLHSWSVETRA